MIQNDSYIPIYQQVSLQIQEEIQTNQRKPGERVDSINALMKKYGIGRVTAVKAIEDLAEKGFVISRQGKGTYVKGRELSEEIMSLRSFHEISANIEADVSNEIIAYGPAKIPNDLFEMIGKVEQDSIHIQRRHTHQNVPIALFDIYILKSIAERAQLECDAIQHQSVYSYLDQRGIYVVEAFQKIGAVSASAKISKKMQVPEGTALLLTQRVSYDAKKNVVMCSNIYYQSDYYGYSVVLKRDSMM